MPWHFTFPGWEARVEVGEWVAELRYEVTDRMRAAGIERPSASPTYSALADQAVMIIQERRKLRASLT
ncbi:hypothetical protein ACFLIM_22065 [Nonomuraea sp. M3C6]|uniref:Uncharacterized protein n=1 Tax=Nonomuraea marmarensis TaxID=3351344 RepID=A0ABW7AEU9_9ACTN